MPRLSYGRILKLSRLLNMMYKPSEIAKEIGVTTETLMRSFLPAGAPATVDKTGQVWINGLEFAAWARKATAGKVTPAKEPMAEDEALCFRCRKIVKMIGMRRKQRNRLMDDVSGTCAECGGKVHRFSGVQR